MEMFLVYSWPGNVRELENNIKRFVILGNESQLISELSRKKRESSFGNTHEEESWIPATQAPRPSAAAPSTKEANGMEEVPVPDKGTLKEVAKIAQRKAEKELIEKVLRHTRWNRRKAAQVLDISYKALLYKIKECGLNQD
jgi:two-component system response regulator AtoC